MIVDFGEIISSSMRWTTTVLFKPFDLKKWMLLILIAFLAGSLSNGCNLNFNNNSQEATNQEHVRTEDGAVKPPETGASQPLSPEQRRFVITLAIIVVAAAVALMIFLIWLGSRFSFVFLDDIVKNDASIKAPFKANRELGNSYFLFNLSAMSLILVLFAGIVYLGGVSLVKADVFTKTVTNIKQVMEILLMALPYLIMLTVLFLTAGVIFLIASNFVIVVMFKDRIKIMRAWAKVWGLLRKNTMNFILYLLLRIGLNIGAGIIYFLVSIVSVIAVMIPLGLIGLPLYFISKAVPAGFLVGYWAAIGVIATPVILFLLYCLIGMYLPFAVFFRAFSVRFLGKIEPHYDIMPNEAVL